MRIRLTPMTWFVILALIAIGLALGLPPDAHAVHQLHTSPTAYRIAVAVLLIPYMLIWYASFYAYAKLQEYSQPLKDTKDGAAFHKISIGMGVLSFSLVVPTIISLTLKSVTMHNPSFGAAATIIDNYIGLFPGMLAFLLLYNGARTLLRTTHGGTRKIDLRWSAPLFFLFAIVFSHLAIANQHRSDAYHLPLWLLITTFIVPYLYGWMLGLLSAYELHWYAKTVKGSLYRLAVKRFGRGIAVTILGSIAVEFINISLAQRINTSLGSVLLVDYGLLAIVALGLILIALGTKKLKRIEGM